MKSYKAVLLLLFAFPSCRQIYPLEIGGGYKIDYNHNSILTLLDSNNTVLSNCFVDGYYRDSNIVLVRCRDKITIDGHFKYTLHLSEERFYVDGNDAMDSVVVFKRLQKMGKENIKITPLP